MGNGKGNAVDCSIVSYISQRLDVCIVIDMKGECSLSRFYCSNRVVRL